jgi:uncharacterized RDD family membrane protein YckC
MTQPAAGWTQQTQAGPAAGLIYGGFWIRLVAYIIDAILLYIVNIILSQVASLGVYGWTSILSIVYFIVLWGWRGQTIGMMPFNMSVVRNEDGGKITWVQAILRYIGLVISFLVIFIGVIWVAFDSRKRGWHDMIAGTVVVRKV